MKKILSLLSFLILFSNVMFAQTDAIYIKSDGNVGIGTSNTANVLLDVAGAVAFREGTITLSNGANNDIALTGNMSFYQVSGPSAAFSISGFAGGVNGRVLTLVNNTTQQMTIVNLNTSAAGNQIRTLNGGNLVSLSAQSAITLHYSSADSKWQVTATRNFSDLNIPAGMISMWSGTLATIPTGWLLCDGTNGTPNLLDKFILGVPDAVTNPGTTGGSHTKTLTTTELPAHTHTGTSDATTPTFTGTAGQTTSSVTPTFTGTADQTTNSVTPTFTGTANQTTNSVTPTYTGTANQTTNSVTPTFTGTAGGTGINSVGHTHTFSVTSGAGSSHGHGLTATTTNYSGGGTRAFYGANAGGGSAMTVAAEAAHTHAVSGTTAGISANHTHSFTPAGTISAVQLTFTSNGTISAVQHTYTATGTISAVQHTYTATGTISAVQPTFTATGSVSSHTHTFTTGSTGTGSAFDIRAKYYTLAYIMKL